MARRSPKSSMPKSPMPKSPMICEKHKSGCAWGLTCIFDLRRMHSNRKLISDKRHVNRDDVGNRDTRNGLNLLSNFDEKSQCIDEGVDSETLTLDSKANVKRLREEEMSTEHQVKKKINISEMEHMQFDSELVDHLQKNQRKTSKTCNRPHHIPPVHGWDVAASVGQQQSYHPNSSDQSLSNLDSAATTEASCNQAHPKSGRDSSSMQKNIGRLRQGRRNETNPQLAQKNGAAEAFVNQMFIDGRFLSRERARHRSKQFLDALQILNSNKELFVKLLEDPNSLLVKHIQDLRDSQETNLQTKSFSEAKLSEYWTRNQRKCCDPVCTHEFKSSNRYPSAVSSDQPSDTIVVLKPGPTSTQNSVDRTSHCSSMQPHYGLRNKGQSIRPTLFSFGRIKRRLRHALGTSKIEQLSVDGMVYETHQNYLGSRDGSKEISGVIVGRNSQSKTYSDIGGMVNSSHGVNGRGKIGKEKKIEFSIGPETPSTSEEAPSTSESAGINSNVSNVRHPKRRETNIYVEPRKNLSEMSSNEKQEFLKKQVSKTLGRTLCLSEYDLLPKFNIEREMELGFGIAQMRFSPYYQLMKENKSWRQKEKQNSCLSPLRQNVETPPWADNRKPNYQLQVFDSMSNIPKNLFPRAKVHESICSRSLSDDLSSRGFMKIVETKYASNPEEIYIFPMPSGSDSTTHNSDTNEITDTTNGCKENGYLECSRLHSSLENQPPRSSLDVSSPSPLSMQKVEGLNSNKDRAEQPSPVSVLEQFYIEEVTSPASTISQLAEMPVQPLQNNFEDHCSPALIRSPLNLEVIVSRPIHEHGSTSEYVRAVLQASCLDWDELQMKCHSPEQLLDPSLFDEEEAWCDQSCSECRHLFDFINEVLLEVYECYFKCSPWLSFIKPTSRVLPLRKNVHDEVMKRVDWHLLQLTSPQTMEKLAEMDLARLGAWMDIQIDTEVIIFEMVEGVLEELIRESTFEL